MRRYIFSVWFWFTARQLRRAERKMENMRQELFG